MITETEVFYNQCGVLVRRATKKDIEVLAPKLSEHDVKEAWVLAHLSPLDALQQGLSSSIFAFTIEYNNKVVAMGGIIPDEILGKKAQLWFLASEELSDMGRIFLANVKNIVGLLLDFYPELYGNIHVDNKKSIIWMKYCGFDIGDARPYGLENALFHPFRIERK